MRCAKQTRSNADLKVGVFVIGLNMVRDQFLILVLIGSVWSEYQPITITEGQKDQLPSESLMFPDSLGRVGSCSRSPNLQFTGDLSFLQFPNEGRFLSGSNDRLYMMDEDTLTCLDDYLWMTDGSFCPSNQDSCPNFIMVYHSLPSDESRLLVCGSQNGNTPQCRTLQILDGAENFEAEATPAFTASNGLISNYPELNGFGEFRNMSSGDITFFSAGFYELDSSNTNVGRDFNITFHDVVYNNGTLTMTDRINVRKDPLWLNFPVTFVDYYRADYGPEFEFYFVFLREGLAGVGQAVIYSRVVRICRNDPGTSGRFTSFVKARIFCEREVPPGREFVGGIDYQYNEISSVVFNDIGRYSESGQWIKLMYGAFSGPIIGPSGTALCVYRADNTGNQGLNKGIFEVFREDLVRVNPDGTTRATENNYVQCDSEGRPEPASNDVLSDQAVSQIGEDPLLILEGTIVTQMVVDTVCVVRSTVMTECVNQDVLFLGTDSGKIVKVAFATLSVREVVPVISEELELDDKSGVTDMAIKQVGGSKYLFVSTDTRLYRLPLERCSRHRGCRNCIAARDPYCIWNNATSSCEVSSILQGSGTGNVPVSHWQNIHSGTVPQCDNQPFCEVIASAIDHQSIQCSVGCNNTFSNIIDISTTLPLPTSEETCDASEDFPDTLPNRNCTQISSTNGLGLHYYDCISSMFRSTVRTLAGPPLGFDDGVYSRCNQSSCLVCVFIQDYTDEIDSYSFQIDYGYQENDLSFTSPLNYIFNTSDCITLSPLIPGVTLFYVVRLQNSVSAISSSLMSVDILDDIPSPVEQIVAMNITHDSVILQWEPPLISNGFIIGYSIYANDIPVIRCTLVATNQYSVENLVSDTDYVMRVHACTRAGESATSPMLNILTDCGNPSVVRNVRVEDVRSNGMTFTWDAPEYNVVSGTSYKTISLCYGLQSVTTQTGVSNSRLYVLTGVLPKTLCCASIRAFSSCGNVNFTSIPFSICEETSNVPLGSITNVQIPEDLISVNSLVLSWSPPLGYNSTPDLRYNVTVRNIISLITSVSYLHLSDLEACTLYDIEVIAEVNALLGPKSRFSAMTKPSLPPPPENIALSFGQFGMILATWDTPFDSSCNYSIFAYNLLLRCNRETLEEIIFHPETSASLNIINFEGFGWCSVQLQSCDTNLISCGSYSDQTVVSFPPGPPSTPRCYIYTELDSVVSIFFGLSMPFIAEDLVVRWKLTEGDNIIFSQRFNLNFNSTLDVEVESNTDYVFNLSICNIYNCSDPCRIDFTTNVVPSPPQNIVITNVTNTSSLITWDRKDNRSFTYLLSISSSCPTANMIIPNITGNSFHLQNLCPINNYTIAMRTFDDIVNKTSVFGVISEFTTRSGVPSEPQIIRYNIADKDITISWISPNKLNGYIIGYDIRWSFKQQCTTDHGNYVPGRVNNPNTNYYIGELVGEDSINSNDIYICVRAVTDESNGLWGINDPQVMQAPILSSSIDTCETLTIAACVAALAIIASAIMTIILSVSICQTGCCSKYKADAKSDNYPKY